MNIGCGKKIHAEYINVDIRDLPGVDVRADARNLPFPSNCFEYILASDIIEHFPAQEAPKIIKEWKRVLAPGGVIEFKLPNLKTIAQAYIDKRIGASKTSWLLYGGQDYDENFHYAGYDRESFRKLVGLNEFEYKEDEFNMIIKFRV